MSDQKTCLHCQKVLPEKIDALDLLGGHYGECAGCRSWKRNHYAQIQNAIVQDSRKHAAQAVPEFLTHFANHADPQWIAIHRASALELLEGYNLTEAEKTDVALMMLGYCNLLERAGLVHGGATEAEAIAAARPTKPL